MFVFILESVWAMSVITQNPDVYMIVFTDFLKIFLANGFGRNMNKGCDKLSNEELGLKNEREIS